MNKYAFLAALAAVPAIVAPAQAASVSEAVDQIVYLKVALIGKAAEILDNTSLSGSQKVSAIQSLTSDLTQINALADSLPDSEFVRAKKDFERKYSNTDLAKAFPRFAQASQACAARGEYDRTPQLRPALEAFLNAAMYAL